MRSALPRWLRLVWLGLSPLACLLAVVVALEKSHATESGSPQDIGSSLMHVAPLFSISGILCCYLLMLWPIPATIYLYRQWSGRSIWDIAMLLVCFLVTVAITAPAGYFAWLR